MYLFISSYNIEIKSLNVCLICFWENFFSFVFYIIIVDIFNIYKLEKSGNYMEM